jgi:hypothetical protein
VGFRDLWCPSAVGMVARKDGCVVVLVGVVGEGFGYGGVGRPQFGSVGPRLFAMSSTYVILFVTMSYFGHNEDMHGFWSI